MVRAKKQWVGRILLPNPNLLCWSNVPTESGLRCATAYPYGCRASTSVTPCGPRRECLPSRDPLTPSDDPTLSRHRDGTERRTPPSDVLQAVLFTVYGGIPVANSPSTQTIHVKIQRCPTPLSSLFSGGLCCVLIHGSAPRQVY